MENAENPKESRPTTLSIIIMGFFKKLKEINEKGGLGEYMAQVVDQKREDLKQTVNEKLLNRSTDSVSKSENENSQDIEDMKGEVSQEFKNMKEEISSEKEHDSHKLSMSQSDSPSFAPMYDEQLEKLIALALADGEITEKEKNILFKRAESLGVDLDEFEMVLDNRINEIQSQKNKQASVPVEEKDTVVQDLLNQLAELEKKQGKYIPIFSQFKDENINEKKARIIKNHPLPNTKEGLLEMLALAAPQGKELSKSQKVWMDWDEKLIYKAWREKCGQIIAKARFFMKDDPQALSLVEKYARELQL